jgi:hypothetical protein
MRAALGSRVAAAKNRPHVESSSKQQSWARRNPARRRTGGGSDSSGPRGPTPRHNALRPMPVTMPRHAAWQPFELERGRDALDRAAAAAATSSTTAPARSRRLASPGALHTRQLQLPGRSSPSSARGGVVHATVEPSEKIRTIEFCTLRGEQPQLVHEGEAVHQVPRLHDETRVVESVQIPKRSHDLFAGRR